MAERRMFAKTIVLSDAFLDMPLGARCLYMTMGMLADDDGFVNSPKAIIRQTGATEDDLKVLIAKRFVLPFESGVIVIKHWRINNYLQKDRYQPTKYLEEKGTLTVDEKGAYHQGQGNVYTNNVYTVKDSIGKYSIGKNSITYNNKTYTNTPCEALLGLTEEEFGRALSDTEKAELARLVDQYGTDKVTDALREASIQKVLKVAYMRGILKNNENNV